MANKLINYKKLQSLLLSNWTEFIDQKMIMKQTLEDTRDANFDIITQPNIPKRQFQLTLTNFELHKGKSVFEIWVEFSIPNDEGVCVGTHIYHLNPDNELKLQNSYGTHFIPKKSNDV